MEGKIFRYILVKLTLLSIAVSEPWPTFIKTTDHFQECYLCPPGYYMKKECPTSRENEPGYSECIKCPSSQYTPDWNRDPRCWDHDICSNNEVKICEHGTIGKAQCGCSGKTHRENGYCVDSISVEDHEWELEKKDKECKSQIAKIKTPACPSWQITFKTFSVVTTCPPCPKTSKDIMPSSTSAVTCSPCDTCSYAPSIILSLFGGILLGIVLGIFMHCFWIWYHSRRYNKSKTKNLIEKNGTANEEVKKKDEQNGNNREDMESGQRKPSDAQPNALPDQLIVQDEKKQPEPEKLVVQLDKKDQGDIQAVDDAAKVDKEVAAKAVPIPQNPDPSEAHWDEFTTICENNILPNEVDSFLRNVLGLRSFDRTKIMQSNEAHTAQIRTGIWQYRNQEGALIANLLKKFREEGWNLIANKIVQSLGIEDAKTEPPKKDLLDEAFARVEELLLNPEEARKLFRAEFNLSDEELRRLKNGNQLEIVPEGLRLWKTHEGNDATAEKLVSLLKNTGLIKIAHDIEDKVLKPANGGQGEAQTRLNVANEQPGSSAVDNEDAKPKKVVRESEDKQMKPGKSDEGAARTNIEVFTEKPGSSAVDNQAGPVYEPNTVPEEVVREMGQPTGQQTTQSPTSEANRTFQTAYPSSEVQDGRPIAAPADVACQPASSNQSALAVSGTNPTQGQFVPDTLPSGEKYVDEGEVRHIDHIKEDPDPGGMARSDSEDGNESETEPKEVWGGTSEEKEVTTRPKTKASFPSDVVYSEENEMSHPADDHTSLNIEESSERPILEQTNQENMDEDANDGDNDDEKSELLSGKKSE